ncbi:hypothetical protein AAVH_33017, partial [Aphelenchoides avenae]
MAANQANNEDVYTESVLEVWENLKLPFSELFDDVVCTVLDSTVKDSDHTQCHQRITQLKGLVASKDAAIKNEQEKIHAYTGTIKLLGDELHKKGAVYVNRSSRYSRCSSTNVGQGALPTKARAAPLLQQCFRRILVNTQAPSVLHTAGGVATALQPPTPLAPPYPPPSIPSR